MYFQVVSFALFPQLVQRTDIPVLMLRVWNEEGHCSTFKSAAEEVTELRQRLCKRESRHRIRGMWRESLFRPQIHDEETVLWCCREKLLRCQMACFSSTRAGWWWCLWLSLSNRQWLVLECSAKWCMFFLVFMGCSSLQRRNCCWKRRGKILNPQVYFLQM